MQQPFGPGLIVTTFAAEDLLLVTLRFAEPADRTMLEACMLKVAEAFALVESIDEKELTDLCWECRYVSSAEVCYTLRRASMDPHYARDFDAAYVRLTGAISHEPVH
jgi:hypothetical protein